MCAIIAVLRNFHARRSEQAGTLNVKYMLCLATPSTYLVWGVEEWVWYAIYYPYIFTNYLFDSCKLESTKQKGVRYLAHFELMTRESISSGMRLAMSHKSCSSWQVKTAASILIQHVYVIDGWCERHEIQWLDRWPVLWHVPCHSPCLLGSSFTSWQPE